MVCGFKQKLQNCSEYTQGKVDSDTVEIRYSLRPMA